MVNCPFCGAETQIWPTYRPGGGKKRYNADGTAHYCSPPPVPVMIECICGQVVVRDHLGGKWLDGKEHVCQKKKALTALPGAMQKSANPHRRILAIKPSTP